MNKKIAVLAVLTALTGLPQVGWAGEKGGGLMRPGTQFNPYVIQQRGDGKAEMSTQYYDPNKGLSSPGQPTNPYVIQQDSFGRTTIQQQFLDYENDGGGDD